METESDPKREKREKRERKKSTFITRTNLHEHFEDVTEFPQTILILFFLDSE